MMIGIGIPSSQSRIGMVVFLLNTVLLITSRL